MVDLEQGLTVLSLFDGMSCGRIALERAGIKVKAYYASEIDKHAIQVSKANWPDIVHIGDVTKVHYYNGLLRCEKQTYNVGFLGGIDLIIAGSPCQGFSFAGKQLNFEDPRSKLFFDFVRLLKAVRKDNPEVYFMLENVMMKKEFQDVISEALGVKPIFINSALVSAQNRKRIYWTNIPYFGAPADKGIYLKDILETEGNGFVINRGERGEQGEKAMCLDANYFKGADNHGQRTMIDYSAGRMVGRKINPETGKRDDYNEDLPIVQRLEINNNPGKTNCLTSVDKDNVLILAGMAADIKGHDVIRRVYSEEGKAPTLTAVCGGNQEPKVAIKQINPSKDAGGKQPYMQDRVYDPNFKSVALTAGYAERLNVGETMLNYRKLTVTECERLQTVPDGYTKRFSASAKQISNTQAYKMLGNGWTVDVIVHIFEPLKYADIL